MLIETNAGHGFYADDIQTDHIPPSPPNSGSLLLDLTYTSSVQQSILASNTNLRNCRPHQAANHAFIRKINKYKYLLQLQPPGTKFLPLPIESLGGTRAEVHNFLLQLAQCARGVSLRASRHRAAHVFKGTMTRVLANFIALALSFFL
jgi:hypothetical protein